MWESSHYDEYLYNLAEKYTFEEIKTKINYEKEFLKSGNLRGEYFESCLDTIDYWEQVLRVKEEIQKDNYEDIIS